MKYNAYETSKGLWNIESEIDDLIEEHIDEQKVRQWLHINMRAGDTFEWESGEDFHESHEPAPSADAERGGMNGGDE